jgi:hypothetical protein
LGEELGTKAAQYPAVDVFVKELKESKGEAELRFRLLGERYACPLNFSFSAEDEVREYVLTRLMVNDRKMIESGEIETISSHDLLLKLNLVAIHAAQATDLRFLDALNYYYELLPDTWWPTTKNGWLLASYLALYGRALMAWL